MSEALETVEVEEAPRLEVLPEETSEMSVKEVEQAIDASPVVEPAPKRKAGRPVGAKTCEEKRGKPRAPRKPKIVEVPVVHEVEEEPPRAVPQSRPIPDDNALMLQLLREQATSRRSRKHAVWRSWFN